MDLVLHTPPSVLSRPSNVLFDVAGGGKKKNNKRNILEEKDYKLAKLVAQFSVD